MEGLSTQDNRNQPDCSCLRVVALLGDDAQIDGIPPEVECVFVSSPYEAAAELLVAPTAALVADLRWLRGRHLRLLEIARQMGAEVMAVGTVPMSVTSEDLSGVRLIARSQLPELLVHLAGTYQAVPPTVPLQPQSKTPEAPRPEPSEPQAEDPHEQLARESLKDFDEKDVAEMLFEPTTGAYIPEPSTVKPPQKPPETSPPSEQAGGVSPSNLLSPEELSALLEDKP